MNKTILVTGAGKGLGYCIAQKHLESGDLVYALEYQITDGLLALELQYKTLTVRKCDISSDESVIDAMKPLTQNNQTIDILYNVAGIFFEADKVPLEETDFSRCMTLYNVNALGPLRIMAQASPLLHPNSVVLNVTSESGSINDCHRLTEYGYSMSKAAINMGSKTFANQKKGQGVRIFCLHPGWMKTDMGGEGARLSDFSITSEESAQALIDIAENPSTIPTDIMYLNYKKEPLNW